MKVTVYTTKGGAGKSPISTNIVHDHGFALGTNEPYHIYDELLPEDQFMAVDLNEPFPMIPEHIDMVFDLAGALSNSALSISTAIAQSDWVIIPIYDEYKSILAGLNTLAEVLHLNKNVLVVATKLQKTHRDKGKSWHECESFKHIQLLVHEKFGGDIPVLPLKFSKVFDEIFKSKKSISQLQAASSLAKFQYREVSKQFDAIYSVILPKNESKK